MAYRMMSDGVLFEVAANSLNNIDWWPNRRRREHHAQENRRKHTSPTKDRRRKNETNKKWQRPKLENRWTNIRLSTKTMANIAEIREFEHMNTLQPYMYIVLGKRQQWIGETERKTNRKSIFWWHDTKLVSILHVMWWWTTAMKRNVVYLKWFFGALRFIKLRPRARSRTRTSRRRRAEKRLMWIWQWLLQCDVCTTQSKNKKHRVCIIIIINVIDVCGVWGALAHTTFDSHFYYFFRLSRSINSWNWKQLMPTHYYY